MRKFLALTISLGFSGVTFAAAPPPAAPTVKVCATWINKQGAHCLTDFQSHELPGNTLYGITELPEGSTEKLEHRWSGLPAEKMHRFERGRLLVSEYKGGPGEGKTVNFTVVDAAGNEVAKRSFDVRWKANQMLAQEIDPKRPLQPEGVPEPERPVPNGTATVTEGPRAAEGGAESSFTLRRGELHAAYRWERGGNDHLTVIPYWNPEYRNPNGWGLGARLGATYWGGRNDDSFPALEADVHGSLPFAVSRTMLSLQPALGLHWWSGRGFSVSPGALVEVQLPKIPVYFVLGFRIWRQEDIGQRLVSFGIGREL